nr:hypothetical protein [Tanacetum cinerariifolium]
MCTPKFVETHNLVAFLEKPTESEEFEQIIEFLNANPINYALTVNHTIYTSCIKQFWATAKVKTVNREEQIQALVDKKKVIITETSVRSDLHSENAKDEHVTTTFNDLLLSGTTKAKQALEIRSLKRKVKKLKKKARKKSHNLKRLYKIDSSTRGRNDQDMFNTSVLDDEEVVAEKEVSTIDPVTIAGKVVTTVGVEVSTAAITP